MSRHSQGVAHQQLRAANARFWITWTLLAVVFFLATHHPRISVTLKDEWRLDGLRALEEGSVKRQVAFVTLGLIGVVGLLTRPRFRYGGNRLLASLAVSYLLWACSSLAWSANKALSLRRLLLLVIIYVSASAVARQFSLRDIQRGIFLVTSVFLLLGVVAELSLGTFSPLAQDYRFTGTQHPNLQGVNCALLILSSIAVLADTRGSIFIRKIPTFVAFVFLFLTRSRTSFFSTVFCTVFSWNVRSTFSKRTIVLLTIVTAGICATLLVGGLTIEQGLSIISMGRFVEQDAETLTGRIPLWRELLFFAGQRPLTGYGYGSFWTPNRVDDISDSQGWNVFMSHSAFLETIVHLGFIGFAIVVGVFSSALLSARRFLGEEQRVHFGFCLSVVLFGCLDGITETFVLEPTWLMFVFSVVVGKLIFDRGCDHTVAHMPSTQQA